MKNFIKLTNFEFNRISKLLFSLMGFVLIVQLGAVIYESTQYLNMFNERMVKEQLTRDQALNMLGHLSFQNVMSNLLFYGPIFICVGAMLFYIFLIWYRDWFGKNTFVYRLLMLPTERLNIYLSKLTVIVMSTLSLVAFQLIAILIERFVFRIIVPADLRSEVFIQRLINDFPPTYLLLPYGFDGFLLMYGLGIMAVVVLFTAILFERSYRWKGIAFGVLYGVFAVALFVTPMILNEELFLDKYFYMNEILMIEVVLGLLIIGLSLWVSWKLINKKVRV